MFLRRLRLRNGLRLAFASGQFLYDRLKIGTSGLPGAGAFREEPVLRAVPFEVLPV